MRYAVPVTILALTILAPVAVERAWPKRAPRPAIEPDQAPTSWGGITLLCSGSTTGTTGLAWSPPRLTCRRCGRSISGETIVQREYGAAAGTEAFRGCLDCLIDLIDAAPPRAVAPVVSGR